jgi:hypothetical protein
MTGVSNSVSFSQPPNISKVPELRVLGMEAQPEWGCAAGGELGVGAFVLSARALAQAGDHGFEGRYSVT